MNYNDIRNQITINIKQIISQEFNISIEDITIEKPNEIKNGNFSTNIALKLTKELKKNPKEIAQIIIDNYTLDENIDKIDIAGPGFINFYLAKEYFKNQILKIQTDENFGHHIQENPENINVEFVSANPTGDLHLGHARNAAYGDAVARLLKKYGHNVEKEYYINDAGAQMKNLARSVLHFYRLLCSLESTFPDDGYAGNDIKLIAQKIYDEYDDTKLDADLAWFQEIAYKINLDEIKRVLGELNVTFDIWSSELELHDRGLVDESLKILDETGDLYEKDGAMWLNTTKYGDDKDRVIEKQDKTHTYLTSDIAYHIDKYNRGFNRLINVWGGDHHGYIKRVKCAIESLGYSPDGIEILTIQMISIVRGSEVVKMSKRAGTSVTIKDLLKEIKPDAMRYFFVMRSPDTQLDFDLDLAQKQSSENPVFYIQYAHARINSLLETVKEKNIKITPTISNISEIEMQLIDKLLIYPNVIKEAASKRLPHILCNYLYDLATMYHRYYNQEKVFTDIESQINDKINIAMSIKKIIKDGLDTLGINAIDKM